MPNEDDPSYDAWREQIEQELATMPGQLVVAGQSVGASVLIKWLTERLDARPIAGAFLMACPFWGGDGWRYEGYEGLERKSGAAANLPPNMPITLYHSRDDEVVPFDHLALWAQATPEATVRACDSGGHRFNNDVSVVARDIASLLT